MEPAVETIVGAPHERLSPQGLAVQINVFGFDVCLERIRLGLGHLAIFDGLVKRSFFRIRNGSAEFGHVHILFARQVEKCFAAVVAYIIGGWLGTYMIVRRRTP